MAVYSVQPESDHCRQLQRRHRNQLRKRQYSRGWPEQRPGFKFVGHTNYNGLNVTVNRRISHGLAVGMNYSYSKAMGDVSTITGNGSLCITCTGQNGIPTNEQYNYGRTSADRTHNLVLTYNYDIPGMAKALGVKGLGLVTDHWALSGITSVQSGSPYNIGCSFAAFSSQGLSTTTGGTTGTGDYGARCNVVGNPYQGIGTNGNGQVYFNANAIAMNTINFTGPANSLVGPPVLGNLGGGAGDLSNPHVTNFDMTLSKSIPLGSEKRILTRSRLKPITSSTIRKSAASVVQRAVRLHHQQADQSADDWLHHRREQRPHHLAFTARIQF